MRTSTAQRLTLDLPPEALEHLAVRVAELLAERDNGDTQNGAGYLDVTGAAEFLACPPSRIYALTSSGRLPHFKDGSRLLFTRDVLRAYVDGGGARRP